MADNVDAYFARIAPEWDRLRQGYFSDEVREEIVRETIPQPEMRVVDVGCGTGFLAEAFAPLVAQVVCVDASTAMLEQARRRLEGHQNVSYYVADGTKIPLDDGSVDVAAANMYLHHTPDPVAALKEMARVLRPGGTLALTDMDEHSEEWMRHEMADLWLGFSREAVRGWLTQAGLEDVTVEGSGQR